MSAPQYIRTYTGLPFNPQSPYEWQFCVEDIAHSLSQLCRFTGHTKTFYSVAQHCVYVSWLCPPEHALWGLHHEDEEPYFNDLNTVVKYMPEMAAYRKLAAAARDTAVVKFGLSAGEPATVKDIDGVMLATEQRDLMRGCTSSLAKAWPLRVKPWSCRRAERVFLLRHKELTKGLTRWEALYMKIVRGRW